MNFEIRSIKKKYGKKEPLIDASLVAKEGQCIGILGKNGAGKSTLLTILAGIQNADSGEFIYSADSESLCDLLKDRHTLADTVGYVPQGTPLFEELSARDNLLLWFDKRSLEA